MTKQGNQLALRVIRKHRLWEVFLVDKLNFNWDEVHEIAEQLEHIKSPLLIKRLDEFLDFPKYDPHGDPIPDEEGEFNETLPVELNEMAENKAVIIRHHLQDGNYKQVNRRGNLVCAENRGVGA